MGRDQKKHEKQKKREQKVRNDRLRTEQGERERRRRDQYPKIFINPANGAPEFVERIRQSLVGFDFDDPAIFCGGERDFYKQIKTRGFPIALQQLRETMQMLRDQGDEFGRTGEANVLLGLGHHILSRIPEDVRRQFMPMNDMHVSFEGRDIVVMFSSLLTSSGDHGVIFHSRQTPTVELEGKLWKVAFSRHAIERICERNNPRYTQYSAAGDAHALFADCVYYEPVVLNGGQPAFAIWDMCFNPTFAQYRTYVQKILGEENLDPSAGKAYFRVGYCPVVFEGDFAKAKTFLYPGYTTTPEYGLVLQTALGRSEKEMLLKQATTHDSTEILLNDHPEAIKWFHDHGIPQVVQMKRDVMIHYADKRRQRGNEEEPAERA